MCQVQVERESGRMLRLWTLDTIWQGLAMCDIGAKGNLAAYKAFYKRGSRSMSKKDSDRPGILCGDNQDWLFSDGCMFLEVLPAVLNIVCCRLGG